MQYSIQDSCIRVSRSNSIDFEQILDSGQVFRFKKYKDCFEVLMGNTICYLKYGRQDAIIETNNVDLAIKFFDLDNDYDKIKQRLIGLNHSLLDKAIAFGAGLRILRQSILETIISFIISANNNIPRIKSIINRLCDKLGEDNGSYKAFPSLEALASENIDFYREIGAGYRAKYLVQTISMLSEGFELDLKGFTTEQARKHLMRLSGVGSKVADCILLFAYHRTDVFPMDTWCKKIYRDMNLPPTDNIILMAKRLTDIFGDDSGYVQQYLYYYYRENKIELMG